MTQEEEEKKIYLAWNNMMIRCNQVNHKQYDDYGGRGIKICEEWQDFEDFYIWSIENGHAMNLGLDRIDNDGNYEPSNCKWSTRLEQQKNRRYNHYITIDEETKSALEWCEIYNLNYNTFSNRHNNLGWDMVKSITTPVMVRKKPKGFVPMEYIDNTGTY